MLVRFTLAAALLALATACTSPTAPVASSNNAARGVVSGDGVLTGSGGHTSTTTPTDDDGVLTGSGG
jgi:hypothetical protein